MDYVELHCRSNFSFLRGASHPDELVAAAASLGYRGLALTDIDTVAGVVRGHGAAKEVQLPFHVGAEIRMTDGPPIVVWPTDRAAYGRLCRLISRGRLRADKGECRLTMDDVAMFADGMMAGIVPSADPADFDDGDDGDVSSRPRLLGCMQWFRDVFGSRGSILWHVRHGVDDDGYARQLRRLSDRFGVPRMAAGGVLYHERRRAAMLDCVTAIRAGVTIDRVQQSRRPHAGFGMRTIDEIRRLYRDDPRAVRRTREVAERLEFSLDDLRYEYPEGLAPPGVSPIDHLRRLTWEGARRRWPAGVPDRVVTQLRHEMSIIRDMHYEAYFLTVWDLVRFARSRGILCQGRGSAANSTVCFCLGVTSVDPGKLDLLFERFVSRERNEAPDIDVDFEHQRREEVLQYLYAKYGRDRAGMTAVVTTYRIRSAIREVGKALGVSPDVVDAIAKLGGTDDGYDFADRVRIGGLDPDGRMGRRFVALVEDITGFPRHLSQHTGGMVITAGPLCELCPIENASMPGRTVVQWNKDDLDELGILKIDVLALGMLSAIRRCFDFVRDHHGRHLTLSNVPADDSPTYDMICRADTMGVFQIESRAQMNMLPRLRPRCYYDLVIEVAIVRPGPIQGDMVHPYLKARQDPGSVVYPNDAIRGVLQRTGGVPIFQEQAMRLAVVAAGFTPGEADQLRRAMAAWRRTGVIEKFRVKLLEGMHAGGLTGHFAQQVFHQIRGFGEYGFPESHAASFALLVYVSCYLKCHYPAAFCAALLNSQPMGFYAPAQLVTCARSHGVTVLPPDVNHSDWDCTLVDGGRESPSLRLGLRLVRGLAETVGRRIETVRARSGAYRSIDDLSRRAHVGGGVLSTLSDADALASICGDRRAAVWDSLDREEHPERRPLLLDIDDDRSAPEGLPMMTEVDEVSGDFAATGLSLRAHPISFAREALETERCTRAVDLPTLRSGRHIRVAGLVLLRQRPETAKGVTFVTLEDETGPMNLVVFPDTWKRFHHVARTDNAWMVDGKLEIREGIVHVIVGRIAALSSVVDEAARVPVKSRDFH